MAFNRRRGGHRGGPRGRVGEGSIRKGPKLPGSLLSEVGGDNGAERSRKHHRPPNNDTRRTSHGPRRKPTAAHREVYEGESDSGPSTTREEKRAGSAPTSKAKRPLGDQKDFKKKRRKLPELTLPEEGEEKVDDAEIEWLEYMMRKEKNKAQPDDLDDGLDDLLDFADIIGPGGEGLRRENASSAAPNSDSDASNLEGINESELEASSGDDDDDNFNEDEVDADDQSESDGPEDHVDVSMEEGDVTGSSDGSDHSRKDDAGVDVGKGAAPQVVDDQEPTRSTTYIPPHLRAAQLKEKAQADKGQAEARANLDRKVQGLLNKLSEMNIAGIVTEIDALYRAHPRNSVTTSITDLTIQMISSRSNLLDSFVALYATLVGALHRVIGLEFGAHFTHTLITRYHTLSRDPSKAAPIPESTLYETPDASKESLNLLTLLAELSNAGVVGSTLIYDLVRDLLAGGTVAEPLSEVAVEALLKILKCSGRQLRSEDPASMKDIVSTIQEKIKGKENGLTVRARFMIDTLVDIKDGKAKAKKAAQQNKDSSDKMTSFLSSLGRSRRLLATVPLRVSLQDLLSAEKKGKWWLVGAGWSGNPLVEREAALFEKAPERGPKRRAVVPEDETILELARKQGMNTDIRRSVFLVLMTSEDYTHACDRLAALRFTPVQQREFVRVTLHCSSVEKTYNPYYTLVVNHLCSESYDHRFTFQYALWDLIRSLPDSGGKEARRKSQNIAKCVAYVIGRGHVDITVLKGIDWTSLDKSITGFVATLAACLIFASQTASPLLALPKAYKAEDFDSDSVEELFQKAMSNVEVSQGLSLVLGRNMSTEGLAKLSEDLSLNQRARLVVAKGVKIAREALKGSV